jgi:RNA polymerase sigma-70 factor (ECF subfamily)
MNACAQSRELLPTRYSLLSRLENWDDQKSWKDFFDTYWRLIYSVALHAGLSEAEAQDVVQETIISVARDIQKFKRDRELGSFKGWLRNITRWRIADQLRKRLPTDTAEDRGIESAPPADLDKLADPAASTLDALWEKEWEENLLKAAIDRVKHRVKEEHFQMFDLYAVKNWPVRKVARTLGVSIGQVYLAKHRVAGLIKKEVHQLQKNPY